MTMKKNKNFKMYPMYPPKKAVIFPAILRISAPRELREHPGFHPGATGSHVVSSPFLGPI